MSFYETRMCKMLVLVLVGELFPPASGVKSVGDFVGAFNCVCTGFFGVEALSSRGVAGGFFDVVATHPNFDGVVCMSEFDSFASFVVFPEGVKGSVPVCGLVL